LLTLEVAERPLRMSELADHVVYSRSGLTRLIDRLEARGYVERTLCTTDRRGMFCAITEKGLDARRGAGPVVLKEVERIFESTTDPDEIAQFDMVLGKMIAAVGGRARDIMAQLQRVANA